jgi:putative hydrolase of the HAD superfamily
MDKGTHHNIRTEGRGYIEKIGPFLQQMEPMQAIATGALPFFKKDPDIKAVLFDIYGTLIISASGDIMQASYNAPMFSDALNGSGFLVRAGEGELMQMQMIFENEVKNGKESAKANGIPFPELDIVKIWQQVLEICESKGLIEFTQHSDIKLYTILFELKSNQVWPMPGMKGVVQALKQKGYPLGIVSNAQFYTPVIMNYFLHDIISSAEDIEGFEPELSIYSYKILRGKPDTFIYEQLLHPLKERGWSPKDVLFVGNDMLKDIYAASQLGFKTCFFAGDKRAYRLRKKHEGAAQCRPDHAITNLNQLLDIL